MIRDENSILNNATLERPGLDFFVIEIGVNLLMIGALTEWVRQIARLGRHRCWWIPSQQEKKVVIKIVLWLYVSLLLQRMA